MHTELRPYIVYSVQAECGPAQLQSTWLPAQLSQFFMRCNFKDTTSGTAICELYVILSNFYHVST